MDENLKHEKFRALCSAHGYKCTPQRFAVYSCAGGNTRHPTVDQIWAEVKRTMPSITRESVFRILMELAEMGIVYRMDRIVNARFDGRPHNHGHFICDRCGTIIDFELSAAQSAPPALEGFLADHVELRIGGLCAKCAGEVKTHDGTEAAESRRNMA
ncbi:MAG: transcriptional repressor [Victivallaceae bacterium]|nr:transcriptional repressor [Victivallaceae bacterium]